MWSNWGFEEAEKRMEGGKKGEMEGGGRKEKEGEFTLYLTDASSYSHYCTLHTGHLASLSLPQAC